MNTSRLRQALPLALALPALACTSAHDVPERDTGPKDAPAIERLERDARMEWWREARFGLFVHFGLYSIPAGAWADRTDHAEWIRTTAQIPRDEYTKLAARFDPRAFDASAWARMAADAGMKYVVVTTKHHDGFALFDSRLTDDWDVAATPFGRDLMRELSTAVRAEGLRMGWYHSIMDWHHPDYLPRRDWETDRPSAGADMDRYVRYLHGQVEELLTRYGEIGVMWFDGEWESTWNHERGAALDDLCRRLQPGVIVNNRVDVGRNGMQGMTSEARYRGDFGTPEQEVPARGLPGVDWESCITMNRNWGFNAADHDWKSSRDLVRMLCDVASKGGNLLLNVGPRADGSFPPEAVERLAAIGRWMRTNGDAIHGTQASPLDAPAWGRITSVPRERSTRLNLIVFEWPQDGKLRVTGLGNEPLRARLVGGPNADLRVERVDADLVVSVPLDAPDADASVVALDVEGPPIVYRAPRFVAAASEFVRPLVLAIDSGSDELVVRYTLDGTDPTSRSSVYERPITLTRTTEVKARTFHGSRAASPVSSATFTKVEPRPAAPLGALAEGLDVFELEGDFQVLPERALAGGVPARVARTIELSARDGGRERFALFFEGFVNVPRDDVWEFELESDDGSRLWIDETVVVDHDGLHSPTARRGTIALAGGLHRLRAGWFNRTGGSVLSVRMASAGEPLRALEGSSLFRSPR